MDECTLTLADVFVGLGRVKMRQGRFVEALPLLEKADSFWRSFDAENRWAGEAALWLARCQQALKRSADATMRRAGQSQFFPARLYPGTIGSARPSAIRTEPSPIQKFRSVGDVRFRRHFS